MSINPAAADAELEAAADTLLRSQPPPAERPAWSERWMQLLADRETELDADRTAAPLELSPELLAEIARAVVDAQLTRTQRETLRMLLAGHSQREIAAASSRHESSVSRQVREIRRRLASVRE